jgi:hypothetical protein
MSGDVHVVYIDSFVKIVDQQSAGAAGHRSKGGRDASDKFDVCWPTNCLAGLAVLRRS